MSSTSTGSFLAGNRARLLYEIIPIPANARVLEVHFPDSRVLEPNQTRYSDVTYAVIDEVSTGSENRGRHPPPWSRNEKFDLIVMHGILDRTRNMLPPTNSDSVQANILRNAYASLNERGTLAASVKNKYSIRCITNNLKYLAGKLVGIKRFQIEHRSWDYWSLKAIATDCGFTDIRMFNVLPGYESPSSLVSTNAIPSRDYFVKQSVRMGGQSSFFKNSIYRILASTTLMRYVEDSFLIWAQK